MAIKVQAHRGGRYREGVPESSLAAFNMAIQADRADGVEWDVNLVKDGVLAVTHGEPELTNRDQFPGMDTKTYLTAYPWTELQNLHLRDHNGTLTSEKMPTNDDVLDLIRDYRAQNAGNADAAEAQRAKDFVANIEIKNPGQAPTPEYIEGAVEQVVKGIKERIGKDGWAPTNFEVRSFNMDILKAAKERLVQEGLVEDGKPSVTVTALLDGGNVNDNGWTINSLSEIEGKLQGIKDKNIRPDRISMTWQSFNTPGINAAIDRFGKDIGKEVKRDAWTWQEEKLDSPQKREAFIGSLVKNDIDTIITDEPARVRSEIEAYQQKNASWAKTNTGT